MSEPVLAAPITSLDDALEGIQNELGRHGSLGLLSVTVLQRDGHHPEGCWRGYEAIFNEISAFLTRRESPIRDSDTVFDPILAGNSLVVLLGPPRGDRDLDRTDLTRVRHRLWRGLKKHLALRIEPEALTPFGVYVGGAMMRHDASVDCQRIVHRGLDEAFVDALGQRRRQGLRQAVSLQRILRSRRVSAVFQPVVHLRERRIIGFEALTRLPPGPFKTPDVVFRVAQENGALWALERLCRRTALEGLPTLEPGQLLFLNVEPDSLHDPDLRRNDFLSRLEQAGLDPTRVVLEITEHAAATDFGALMRAVGEVRSLGFRMAMDDVGSGYANLQSISEIRPEFLKADLSLVRDLHRDPIKRELVSTIQRFAETTGTTLVAEGVESPDELQALREIGVPCAQGYLLARPEAKPAPLDWSKLEPVAAGTA